MSSPWNRKYFSSLVLGHSLLFIAIIIMVELTVVVDGFLKGILHSMESKLRPLITKLVFFMFYLPLPTYLNILRPTLRILCPTFKAFYQLRPPLRCFQCIKTNRQRRLDVGFGCGTNLVVHFGFQQMWLWVQIHCSATFTKV